MKKLILSFTVVSVFIISSCSKTELPRDNKVDANAKTNVDANVADDVKGNNSSDIALKRGVARW